MLLQFRTLPEAILSLFSLGGSLYLLSEFLLYKNTEKKKRENDFLK